MAMQKSDISYVEKTLNQLRFNSIQRQELLAAIKIKPALFRALIQFSEIFLSNKHDFSHIFVTSLATAKDGLENIHAYIRFYPALNDMKFRFQDVKRMTDKHPARLIFEVIVQNRIFLKKSNIAVSDIVKLCEMTENINEFKTLMPSYQKLLRLNISRLNIIFLMKHQLIGRFLTFANELSIYSLPNDILDYFIQESATLNHLVCLFDFSVYLQSLSISMNSVIEFCSKSNIKELIQYVQTYFPNLLLRNFDLERLCQLLLAENGMQNIEVLSRLVPILGPKGYGNETLLSLIEHKNGAIYLQRLYARHTQFCSSELTPADILKMVISEIEKEESLIDNDLSSYLKEIDSSRRFYQNKLTKGEGLTASEYADYLLKEYDEWRNARESSSPTFF